MTQNAHEMEQGASEVRRKADARRKCVEPAPTHTPKPRSQRASKVRRNRVETASNVCPREVRRSASGVYEVAPTHPRPTHPTNTTPTPQPSSALPALTVGGRCNQRRAAERPGLVPFGGPPAAGAPGGRRCGRPSWSLASLRRLPRLETGSQTVVLIGSQGDSRSGEACGHRLGHETARQVLIRCCVEIREEEWT